MKKIFELCKNDGMLGTPTESLLSQPHALYENFAKKMYVVFFCVFNLSVETEKDNKIQYIDINPLYELLQTVEYDMEFEKSGMLSFDEKTKDGYIDIANETMDNFRKAYDINVSGPMYLSQLFISSMEKSKSPTIIFISSLGGKFAYRSGGNYTNAKRGMMALVDTMRLEFPAYGIKVTEICPGTIDTQKEKRDIALTAEDMAECILWVSELPSHVNINHIELNHIDSGKY